MKKGIALAIIVIIVLSAMIVRINNKNYIPFKTEQTLRSRNIAIPDLTGKEDLGDGVYKIYDFLTYNVVSGIYTANGTPNQRYDLIFPLIKGQYNAFIQPISTSGFSGNAFIAGFYEQGAQRDIKALGDFTYNINFEYSNTDNFRFIFGLSTHTFNNYHFKFQIEKGTTATYYTVPSQTLSAYTTYEDNLNEKEKADIGLMGITSLTNLVNTVTQTYGYAEKVIKTVTNYLDSDKVKKTIKDWFILPLPIFPKMRW